MEKFVPISATNRRPTPGGRVGMKPVAASPQSGPVNTALRMNPTAISTIAATSARSTNRYVLRLNTTAATARVHRAVHMTGLPPNMSDSPRPDPTAFPTENISVIPKTPIPAITPVPLPSTSLMVVISEPRECRAIRTLMSVKASMSTVDTAMTQIRLYPNRPPACTALVRFPGPNCQAPTTKAGPAMARICNHRGRSSETATSLGPRRSGSILSRSEVMTTPRT